MCTTKGYHRSSTSTKQRVNVGTFIILWSSTCKINFNQKYILTVLEVRNNKELVELSRCRLAALSENFVENYSVQRIYVTLRRKSKDGH